MCRLFAAVRVPPDEPEDETVVAGTSDYHLRLFSFLRATNLVHINRSLPKPVRNADAPCLLVFGGKGSSQSPGDRPQISKAMVRRGQSSGTICPVVSSATASPPLVGTRRLLPDRIDYDVLQGWYKFCAQHHRKTCAISSKDYPEKLKVIECRTQKIIAAPPSCSYVALSYVWGQQHSTTVSWPKSPSRNTEPSILSPDTIPSVIRDAMTVALELGYNYLWVDRYCIDQDDEAKHVQINQMDKVYSSAIITIIAAAGDDAGYGLPGVSSISRRVQPSATIRGRLLASTMRSSQETIGSSRWATRGWTYQEAALSKRRLIFTKEQVFYECKLMSCCEATSVPLDLLHYDRFEDGFRSMIQRGYFETHAENTSTRLETYAKFARQVEQFTARELSYEKDSLNAFIGVLNYYTNGQGPKSLPFHTHMGLPCNAEPSKYIQPLLPGDAQPSNHTPQLLRSLLWEHNRFLNRVPPKRRRGYPSYSWAGWAGVATLPETQTILLKHFKTSLHRKRDPEAASDFLAPLGATIDLETYVVQGQVDFSEGPDSSGSHTKFHLKTWGGPEKAPGGRIWLPDDFLSRHKPSAGPQIFSVDCLMLARSSASSSFYFMLIEQREGIAERVGIAILYLYYEEFQNLLKTKRRICLG